MFLVDFPCWALGSFLYFLCMQENSYGGGRILGSLVCVLRMKGFDGLRERFEDDVIFSLFKYCFFMYFPNLVL